MSSTRFLGNRPIKTKSTILAKEEATPESSFDAIFDDTFASQEDKSSTPKSAPRQESKLSSSSSYSMLSSQEKLLLSSWGLPDTVQRQYERNGISSMFQWQADCLSIGNVLEGKNENSISKVNDQ